MVLDMVNAYDRFPRIVVTEGGRRSRTGSWPSGCGLTPDRYYESHLAQVRAAIDRGCPSTVTSAGRCWTTSNGPPAASPSSGLVYVDYEDSATRRRRTAATGSPNNSVGRRYHRHETGGFIAACAVLAATACSAPAADAGSVPPKPTSWTTGAWAPPASTTRTRCPNQRPRPSVRHKGCCGAINDSGNDPVLYAIGRVRLPDQEAVTLTSPARLEALASGRNAAGQPVLWVGDIGDNLAARSSVAVLEVREPDLGVTGSALTHPTSRILVASGCRGADGDRDGSHLFVIAKSAWPDVPDPGRDRHGAGAQTHDDSPRSRRTPASSNRGYAIRDYVAITRYRAPIPGSRIGRNSPPLLRRSRPWRSVARATGCTPPRRATPACCERRCVGPSEPANDNHFH